MKVSIVLLYLVPLFVIVNTEEVFLFHEIFGLNKNIPDSLHFISLISGIIFYNKLNKFLKIWLIFSVLYFTILVLESLYTYNSILQYPHVFSKITKVFLIFGFYLFYNSFPKRYFKFFTWLVFITFCINIIFLKREHFSLTFFYHIARPLNEHSSFLLLLVSLYFFNGYLKNKRLIELFVTLIIWAFLIFVQYRSVWVATFFALLISFYFIKGSKGLKRIKVFDTKLVLLFFSFIIIFSLYFTYKTKTHFIDRLVERAEEILQPTETGTGSWRYQMYLEYKPYIQNHLITGMRFDGFELPGQFYNEGTDMLVWDEGSGHHFHSAYIDTLFYVGLIGLILVFSPIFYLTIVSLKNKNTDSYSIAIISFVISGLVYGISYVLVDFYFAIAGIAFCYLDEFNNATQKISHSENK